MPCFLQTLTGNGPDFGSKTACLCTVGPIVPFSVSNSWCVHPRLCCSSFSSSATRLGGWDLSYLVEYILRSTPHFIDFWLDRFHWFHWLHCAYWLVAVRSFDVMLWFLDVEIGGKKRRKVPGIAFKHIQARCEFFELYNCRSDKTDKQIHLLAYSMSWASPSLTRHDVPLKDQVPCPSWNFVQRLTVALLHGVVQKWRLLICSQCLGFEH